ncbi:hypothetical protein PVAP13_3KG245927 [Panicum virgatum]|uniref:Uncharacterized protein n=1 Tax=Panicum virgatum TaxID=38727 RepID=A0A8T0V6V5_PANVG|nr:hypothetical protein PVAP13_3KG245927 [Panicum virgatum]
MARANRLFLQSSSNQGKWVSMLPHCVASAGYLSLPSSVFFRPSLCQRKSWASFRVANMRFKRGMMGKYHATLTGPPLLPFLPLISSGSFPSSALLSLPSLGLLKCSNPRLGQLLRQTRPLGFPLVACLLADPIVV